MKNLTIHSQSIHEFNRTENYHEYKNILQPDVVCCSHPDNRFIYILYSNHFYLIDVEEQVVTKIDNICNIYNDVPIGIEQKYEMDEHVLYCAYESGNLVKIAHEISENNPVSIIVQSRIDDGLRCIKFSPDQEILTLITKTDTMITMLSNLEIISQVDLNLSTFGEKQFITAGWGQKETQFHGSEGKAAAKIKSIFIGKSETDSGLPSITWRGDGTMFAISFLSKTDNARQFKVFNREGILQYTSELTDGLEENISWKPSGNLIATTQQLPNKYVVALFEKNGLKHRDFSLPFKVNEIEVRNLMWSLDSEVLTVWCKKKNSKATILLLYTENNYHWYLKQTIEFTPENPLIYYTWSSNSRVKKQLILLTVEKLVICSFIWTIDQTRGKSAADKATVGVIDGDRVFLTSFKMGIMPPPMCHQSLQISQAINECIFAPYCHDDSWFNPNFLFCLLQNNQLALCAHTHNDELQYKYIRSYDIEWDIPMKIKDDKFRYSLHHFLWLKDDIILCSASDKTHSYLCVIKLEDMNTDNGRVAVREVFTMDEHIHHIVHSPDINIAYIIVGIHVFKYTYGDNAIMTKITVPECCSQVEVVEIENCHVIVALDTRNRLFLDGTVVANNITSLCIHPHFLLLTTLQHALVSVTMNKDGFERLSTSNLSIKCWTNEYAEKEHSGLSLRRLERGSSLLTTIPNDAKCILQMPRGNIETIQPRPLSLMILKTHLNNLNYFAAFDIMRKQRINLNLIYDHDPNLFIANAEKFIDDIKNPCWLNLFVSELQEEDVSDTIYKLCYNEQENKIRKNADQPIEGKVELICQLLRGIMEKKSTSRNLVQPILTCLVKNKRIAGLEAALRKINEFKMKEVTAKGRQQTAEEALKYLLYLIDVNVLFDIALGMHDLELAKFVASKSQKDPKEYIPYLNSLGELEANYRKYKIDCDLKRYQSALCHIAKQSDKFEECVKLICEHKLYTQALKLFPRDSEEYKKVARVFGQYLVINKKYREAGVMYQRSDDLDRALQVYKTCGMWREAIIVSTQLEMPPAELNKLYVDLVNRMRHDKQYRDAAEISFKNLQQPEEAVELLCLGKEWRDAVLIAHTSRRLDLIETHIKPGIYEHANDLLSSITNNKEEYLTHKKRLAIVRKEKENRQSQVLNVFAELDENAGKGFSDLLSETSSVAGSTSSVSSSSSKSSGRSYKSSKNRRKQERKVLSIKEGSVFEDLALIRALHIIMTTTYLQRKEVHNVNRLLLNFNFDELAETLQNTLSDILSLFEKYQHEIWPKNSNNFHKFGINDDDNDENYRPQCLLEPKFNYPPEVDSWNWTLKIFPEVEQTVADHYL